MIRHFAGPTIRAEKSDLTTTGVFADREGNKFEFRPIDCAVCRERNCSIFGLRGGRYHRYGLGVATRIVRCNTCSLIYCDPFPFPLEPQVLYGDPAKYFGGADDSAKIAAYGRVVREICSRSSASVPSILDVGSGRGELLRAAGLAGLPDVIGLEFSESMIAQAKAVYGVTVLQESVEDHATRSGRTYDAVVLSAVLEHVYRPGAMIEAVARVTAPGSLLYIDVPNEPNLMTMVGNRVNRFRRSEGVFNLAPTFPPYHVFGFNPRAIAVLLERHSFTIEKCHVWADPRIPAHGGLGDRAKALVATQINRVANMTRSAHNMTVWARRR